MPERITTIRLTEQDQETIDRLMRMGFGRSTTDAIGFALSVARTMTDSPERLLQVVLQAAQDDLARRGGAVEKPAPAKTLHPGKAKADKRGRSARAATAATATAQTQTAPKKAKAAEILARILG